jgi:hypothetical protein
VTVLGQGFDSGRLHQLLQEVTPLESGLALRIHGGRISGQPAASATCPRNEDFRHSVSGPMRLAGTRGLAASGHALEAFA